MFTTTKLRKYFSIAFLLISYSGLGCDVCGCQMGGMSLGITPQKNSNFIGLNYNYANFKASIQHNSIYLEDERSNDTYTSVDLVAKFNLNKKFWIYSVVPYGYNIMDGSLQSVKSNGIKDPIAILFAKVLDTQPDSTNSNWFHLLNLGAGFKAPLGNFNLTDQQSDSPQIINPNFQMGSGSWDGLGLLSYKVKYKKIGFSNEHIFKVNGKNSNQYKFGNQYNTSFNVFSWWFKKGYSFLPFAGAYYEWGGIHKEGENQTTVTNTGGQAIYTNLGTKLIYNNWGINLLAQLPISQNFNTDSNTSIIGGWRFQIGLRYYFEKWTGWKK